LDYIYAYFLVLFITLAILVTLIVFGISKKDMRTDQFAFLGTSNEKPYGSVLI